MLAPLVLVSLRRRSRWVVGKAKALVIVNCEKLVKEETQGDMILLHKPVQMGGLGWASQIPGRGANEGRQRVPGGDPREVS